MFHCDHYSNILSEILSERKKINPNYSLRAFARDLGLSSSRVSEIINRKQGLSKDAAKKISKKLNFNKVEDEFFSDLVEAKNARSKSSREDAERRLEKKQIGKEQQLLREQAFRIISDWYHFAILELTMTDGFRSSTIWIAKRLGISVTEATEAVHRLKSLGLMVIEEGRFIPTDNALITGDGIPSKSIRHFNQQVLQKSMIAIDRKSVV